MRKPFDANKSSCRLFHSSGALTLTENAQPILVFSVSWEQTAGSCLRISGYAGAAVQIYNLDPGHEGF